MTGRTPGRGPTTHRDPQSSSNYAAVILYYRLGAEIRGTVDALLHQSHPPVEVVIVDNHSLDGVLPRLEQVFGNQVRVIYLPDNRGYSGGMKAGCESLSTDAEYVLLMTHEVVLGGTCARELVAALELDPAISQAGPVIVDARTKRIWSTGGIIDRLGSVKHDLRIPSATVQTADWLDGCCSMVPRRWTTASLFDSRYFLYWEDVDMSSTLARYGRVVVVREAHATQSTGTAPIYYATRNRIIYWKKQRRPAYVITASLHALTKIVANDLIAMDKTSAAARWHGLLDGWTGLIRMSHSNARERGREFLNG